MCITKRPPGQVREDDTLEKGEELNPCAVNDLMLLVAKELQNCGQAAPWLCHAQGLSIVMPSLFQTLVYSKVLMTTSNL